MKIFMQGMLMLGGVFFANVLQAGEKPRPVVAPVEKIFVPIGFDSNDDAEIVVHGHFPNSCYKIGPMIGEVDEAHHIVNVKALAYYYEDPSCTEMLVPFIHSIKLGILNVGDYQIKVYQRPNVEVRPLSIGRAVHDGPDDFLYAPVSQVRMRGVGQQYLTIEGEYPLMFVGCMQIKEMRTYASPGNVIVVQPIAEIKKDQDCQNVDRAFSFSTPLLDLPASGEYLIHVRVLAGNSINKLVNIVP